MSSTNRSKKSYSKREGMGDYYITPVSEIVKFLDDFIQYESLDNKHILDPCAGGDKNHPMSYPKAINDCKINCSRLNTVDIREDSLADFKGNFLECNTRSEVVITNPPFFIAEDILHKALNDVVDGGLVILLLRLNFLGSKKRKQTLWDKHLPKYVFVHNSRMSFTDNGNRDSVEYGHFVWYKNYYPEFTNMKVI